MCGSHQRLFTLARRKNDIVSTKCRPSTKLHRFERHLAKKQHRPANIISCNFIRNRAVTALITYDENATEHIPYDSSINHLTQVFFKSHAAQLIPTKARIDRHASKNRRAWQASKHNYAKIFD